MDLVVRLVVVGAMSALVLLQMLAPATTCCAQDSAGAAAGLLTLSRSI
jgi:hypothetical protein